MHKFISVAAVHKASSIRQNINGAVSDCEKCVLRDYFFSFFKPNATQRRIRVNLTSIFQVIILVSSIEFLQIFG